MDLDPQERTLRARLAAHTSWANTSDPAGRTAKARRAASERFETQVDPEGVLTPEERTRRAAHARKAFYTAMALKSVRARRDKARKSSGAQSPKAA
jgi:hypothetical protein